MSITYIGVVVLLLSGLLKAAGVQVSNEAISNFVLIGGQIIGAVVALWGRWRAGGVSIFGVRN